MTIKPGSHLYFVGIGGTGMASVAGLCQSAGYRVTGSDTEMYPPMSTMLEELGIKVATPYAASNVAAGADVYVIANVLSRGNAEVEAVLASGRPYVSFPQLLGECFLKDRTSIVVSGTHGKTTTTALMAHVLNELGEDPSFLVGGIPRNFPRSYRLGKSALFVIEGDEYDTAFFDKGPKFLHYHPTYLIVNNLEFDHADIYANLEAIEDQFAKLCDLVKEPSRILANIDDPGVAHLVKRLGRKLTKVSTLGASPDAAVRVVNMQPGTDGQGQPLWHATIATQAWGTLVLETKLSGKHNIANIAQVIACLEALLRDGFLRKKPEAAAISAAVRSFLGVKRRLDHLASFEGIDVYEDFAHHPTAVGLVIEGFQKVFPGRRVLVAFEPRNATSRRNVFQNDYVSALAKADRVFIGKCPVDQRIPEAQRMNTNAIVSGIGQKAQAYDDNEILLSQLEHALQPGDAVIFMSSGSFSGVQYRLAEQLRAKAASAR